MDESIHFFIKNKRKTSDNTNTEYIKKKFIQNKRKYSLKIINFCLLFWFFFFYKSPYTHLDNISENIFFHFSKDTEEKNSIENYYHLSENGILLGKIRERRIKNPKISIIIPIYNDEKYIKRIITSIKNQSYKDIEIIFIDDASTDNSINQIEKYKRKDKRIRIIKHHKKECLFITRNDGVLNAKGEYIVFIEPNGLLIGEILKKLFGAIELYGTDIIRFESFYLYNNTFEKYEFEYYLKKDKIIYQPDILKLSFYPYEGELYQHNLNLWGKAIKTKLYKKVLNNLNNYYKNKNWNLYEDNAMDFILLKNAETYIFINENGYIDGMKENIYNNKDNNEIVKNLFLLAEIFFDYTEDNIYEKTMANYQIKRIFYEYKNNLEGISEGFEYYYNILDKFSNCKSILKQQQYYINQVRSILNKAEKKY